jgi:uncharacterized OB-fold protein
MDKPLNDTRSVLRRPIAPSNFSKPFWDASGQKRLLLQYCERTGQYQFFPRPLSLFTARRGGLVWRESPGRGSVYTYTVTHLGAGPFRGHEPFIVALVELEEGVRILANIVNCTAEQIHIGLPVSPFWHELGDGKCLLMFEPR